MEVALPMKLLEGQERPWSGIRAMCHTLTWKESVNSGLGLFFQAALTLEVLIYPWNS